MPPKRLLAVLPLPEQVHRHLQAAVDSLRASTPGVPWTSPQSWHVRLAHFGSLEERKVDAVAAAMTELTSYCEPLRLRLNGTVVDPRTGPADTLCLAVEGDVADLQTLANAIPDFVGRGPKLYIDRRAFRPVVVLARASRAAFEPTAAASALGRYDGPTWTADHVQVVQHTYRSGEGDQYAGMWVHPFTSGGAGAR